MLNKRGIIAICVINIIVLLINILFIKELSPYLNTFPGTAFGRESTCNTVMVVDKEKKNLKITVKDKIYNTDKYQNFDIYVRNENTWNLIQKQQEYFISYEKVMNGNYYLEQIEVVDGYIE